MPIAKGDAMTAPLSAERAKELREQIRTGAVVIWSPDISGVADIINIVERYSAMRAEMENLEGQLIDYAWLNGELLESKKKAEAENDKLITELSHHQHDLFYEKQAREKAEAELVDEQKRRAAIAESLQDHQDEIERLRADCAVATKMLDLADGIIEKQGAELLTAQMTNAKNGAVIIEQMAQLAKQAPLIEAIGGPGEGEIEWGQYSTTKTAEAILRAALALREEKK